ncbi:hypothetical protein PHYSODRAFT_263692 [Phytophthora sojae]|uniref:Uncharacterized protein n=1 Tax=Phytophthora sojae (strain P6497) TaxID=1094619 RepID=G4ZAR5_PHYSP|nr:hypothetical protein PHYSODRAFT_263692 [Phytophthora sojae]EGZ19851.1 hypothetical protein PHYSODRAFT_263692 [Phytophthora sojae]|eukprot:XP_009522568.1 hypothetical protein PHYSODRAFT_263692 [Phytophthora sojae]
MTQTNPDVRPTLEKCRYSSCVSEAPEVASAYDVDGVSAAKRRPAPRGFCVRVWHSAEPRRSWGRDDFDGGTPRHASSHDAIPSPVASRAGAKTLAPSSPPSTTVVSVKTTRTVSITKTVMVKTTSVKTTHVSRPRTTTVMGLPWLTTTAYTCAHVYEEA